MKKFIMASRFLRKITLNERLYLLGESIAPPMAIQYIIKGTGFLHSEKIRNKLLHLTELIPSLRLQIKGNRWFENGRPPALIVHEETFSDEWNAPVFHSRMDIRKGQSAEFHIFNKPEPVLIFRVLHCVMDAKGAQQVLINLFALLRGEKIDPLQGFPADMYMRNQLLSREKKSHNPHSFQSPGFTLSPSAPMQYQTSVLQLDFRLEAPVAKIASWYAQQLNQESRVMIPVDLRRHAAVPAAFSNLTLPVYLSLSPGQNWQKIQASLLQVMANQEELSRERFEALGLAVPASLMKNAMKFAVRRAAKHQRFPLSGILSDNGLIELASLSGPDLRARCVISLPVYIPLAPFFVTVVHHRQQSNLAISVPKGQELSVIKNSLLNFLSSDTPKPAAEDTAEDLPPEELQSLRSLWAEVLECPEESVGPDIMFFNLGGDSLKLLQLLSEVSVQFPMKSESTFFQEILDTGGRLSIRSMINIMAAHR